MNKIQYELYKLMVVQIGIKALLFATEIASEYGVRFCQRAVQTEAGVSSSKGSTPAGAKLALCGFR